MREEHIVQIKKRSDNIEKSFDELLDKFRKIINTDGRPFDLSKIIPDTDSSLSDLRARAAVIAGLIRKFDNSGGTLTPISDFTGMLNAGNALTNSISQTAEQIQRQVVQVEGGVSSIDYGNFYIHLNSGLTANLNPYIKLVFESFEVYLTSFHQVFLKINPSRAAFNFSSATEALSKTISQFDTIYNQMRIRLSETEKSLERFRSEQASFNALIDDVRAKHSLLNEQAAQSAEAISSIAAKNEEASSLSMATSKLKETVENYEASFTNFREQLDGMKEAYQTGDQRLKQLIKNFDEQSLSFETMIERSNEMLSASTVAGLASEFGNIRKDLEEKLESSHTSFKISVGILGLSALPLIVFIFAPFLVAAFPENKNLVNAVTGLSADKGGWHYLGQVLARFIILLPALWYVSFCTARYSSLFKLKEHYSYKYSMAVSVDGFKKQAPEYKELIAALVFENLSFNPADKLGKQNDGPVSPLNPIAELLLKTLRKNVDPQE